MPTTITVRKNGPCRIEGDEPFCDTTHSTVGLIGAQEAVRESEGGTP